MKTTLCWDLDGTLIHSKAIWSKAMLWGLEVEPGDEPLPTLEVVRAADRRFVWDYTDMDTRHLVEERWWQFMTDRFIQTYADLSISPLRAARAAARIREYILRVGNYSLYPDTLYILEACRRKGAGCVLVSNNYPEADQTVRALGLWDYFDGVVISGKVGLDKPDPRIFKMAMELCAADRYIMVGDNLKADIKGAAGVGMTTVYVHRGQSALADYCFDELRAIEDIL